MKRQITEPEKKWVAARQAWRCSVCNRLLESTYQVDHTVALMNDGKDHISNMTAMCVRCHAKKTQMEHIVKGNLKRNTDKATVEVEHDVSLVEDREDRMIEGGRFAQCSVCRRIRRATLGWEMHRCLGKAVVKIDLSAYRYKPGVGDGAYGKPKE